MRFIEFLGLVFLTAILAALVIPIPCLPPSCGPPDAAPLTTFQIIQVYLYQPLIWIIILSWVIAIIIWVRRSKKK